MARWKLRVSAAAIVIRAANVGVSCRASNPDRGRSGKKIPSAEGAVADQFGRLERAVDRGRFAAALTPAYVQVAQRLPDEAVLGIDESPTKEARGKAWPGTFVAGTYTVFALRAT